MWPVGRRHTLTPDIPGPYRHTNLHIITIHSPTEIWKSFNFSSRKMTKCWDGLRDYVHRLREKLSPTPHTLPTLCESQVHSKSEEALWPQYQIYRKFQTCGQTIAHAPNGLIEYYRAKAPPSHLLRPPCMPKTIASTCTNRPRRSITGPQKSLIWRNTYHKFGNYLIIPSTIHYWSAFLC